MSQQGTRQPSPARRLSGVLHRHPVLRLTLLLVAPMLVLVVVYLGSLAVLLVSAFWTTDDFTGEIAFSFGGGFGGGRGGPPGGPRGSRGLGRRRGGRYG